MKTFFASALALVLSASLAFAGNAGHASRAAGKKALHGCARHYQSVSETSAVIFGYPSAKGSAYQWTQADGPATAQLIGAQTPTLIAAELKTGSYIFTLTTTTPDGYKATDSIVVKVKHPAAVAQL